MHNSVWKELGVRHVIFPIHDLLFSQPVNGHYLVRTNILLFSISSYKFDALAKFQFKKGLLKQFINERRDYKSVDEKSLS